jgi:hypothetical protein
MRATHRAILLVASLLLVAPFGARSLLSRAPVARAAAETASRLRIQEPGTPSLRERPATQQLSPSDRERFLRRILPKLGSQVAFQKVARALGVTEWHGKRLDLPSRKTATQRLGLDQPVDSFDGSQNEPSIAVNPMDESVVVVFAHNDLNFSGYDIACSIYVSFDAGNSFFYEDDAPLLDPTDDCSDPVVRYAPDGSVVYYSYMSIRDDGSTSDVVVSVGDGADPASVTGPTVVLPGLADFMDKPWLGVHTFDAADGAMDSPGYVYVTGTLFLAGGGCALLINRSADYGVTWDFAATGGQLLGGGANDCDTNFLQGTRVEGGPGQQVLACYFNSGADGFTPLLLPPTLSNRFDITCVSSADRWDTISAPITAAGNVAYELNEFLGPNDAYHRWWGGMFPAIAIDHQGIAHVTFTMDPTASKVDAESGNVQYVKSAASALNPPYTTWSGRKTVGSGARAQGYATVVAQRSNLSTQSYIYIAYMDHYRSTSAAPNLIYDVRYRRSINSGGTFAKPVKVTDNPSLSDFIFIGDYIDSAATMRRFHLVWTDRADKTSIFDFEDDIFADRF